MYCILYNIHIQNKQYGHPPGGSQVSASRCAYSFWDIQYVGGGKITRFPGSLGLFLLKHLKAEMVRVNKAQGTSTSD